MKNSKLRIFPLPTDIAEKARHTTESGAVDHAVIRVDSPTGYPCRHCLRFAQPGERVILFPYTSIPAGHPYSETGPIFVHAEPNGTAQRKNTQPTFAMAACSALTITITT